MSPNFCPHTYSPNTHKFSQFFHWHTQNDWVSRRVEWVTCRLNGWRRCGLHTRCLAFLSRVKPVVVAFTAAVVERLTVTWWTHVRVLHHVVVARTCFPRRLQAPVCKHTPAHRYRIIDLRESAPSLGVYYFLSLTLSVCMSVCRRDCNNLLKHKNGSLTRKRRLRATEVTQRRPARLCQEYLAKERWTQPIDEFLCVVLT